MYYFYYKKKHFFFERFANLMRKIISKIEQKKNLQIIVITFENEMALFAQNIFFALFEII